MKRSWLVVALLVTLFGGCAAPPPPSSAQPAATTTATVLPPDAAGPSSTLRATAHESSVLALTLDHPTLTIIPATHLHDGQVVEVRVTGFGVGAKVWLSECASAAAASDLGCGAELARQTLLVTGDDRSGRVFFTVHADASTQHLEATPTQRCTNQCVIVATQGDYRFALIAFDDP